MIKNWLTNVIGNKSPFGGSSTFNISGAVDNYGDLPDATTVPNELWFVRNSSSVLFPKYPRGLYYSDGVDWEQTPIKVQWSEDAGSVVNWLNWTDWFDSAMDVGVGDRVIYQGIEYENKTGTQTGTAPDTDTTNWYSYKQIQLLNDEIIVTSEGDDAGVNFINQLSVGTPFDPKELVVGQGDSTVEGMVGYHTDDDITYVDITDIIASDTGSTIGLFNGTTAGKIIYIGSDFIFSGVKVKINTAGIIEPANVLIEYWDGTQWDFANFMATDADFPYSQYGWSLTNNDNTSEQWRVDLDPYELRDPWVKNTINGVEKYWSRFRIVSNITQDAIIEQVKIHTSRWECNSDGTTEYFGLGRYKKTILSGINNLVNNAALSPANESVDYSNLVVAGYTDNQLNNGAFDSRLFILNVDEGLDTSIKIEVRISYYVDGPDTGDIEFRLTKIPVMDDFVYDGTALEEDLQTQIETISVNSDLVRKTAVLYMPVNEGTPAEAYVFVLSRDARGTNPNDTLPDNVILTHIVVNGYFWRP